MPDWWNWPTCFWTTIILCVLFALFKFVFIYIDVD